MKRAAQNCWIIWLISTQLNTNNFICRWHVLMSRALIISDLAQRHREKHKISNLNLFNGKVLHLILYMNYPLPECSMEKFPSLENDITNTIRYFMNQEK